ncbi:MAG TPA: filamentous hemagglutinin N-terminal domain-containing protein [Chlamydiales bacterium]|nr:filamentous hemagglutinin N-terminal domain-containing protein [Chlamydiales bacterium]
MRKSILILFLISSSLVANPTEMDVQHGNVSISHKSLNTLEVTASDSSIIHWKSFSIEKGEVTRFILPSETSAILNRVTGQEMSRISGLLQSNGQIYLLNENGIYIDGKIQAAGFIASCLKLTDDGFLNQSYLFKGENSSSIINTGEIKASDGGVYLFAHHIENVGNIETSGTCGMGSGSEIYFQPQGKEQIIIKAHLENQNDPEQIVHEGTIKASVVEMRAKSNPYALAIHNKGYIEAKGFKKEEGKVFLIVEQGNLENAGTITAKQSEDIGGEVRLIGEKVRLYEEAKIDVSADTQGGTVLIGGDYQGKNLDVMNADYTLIEKDVQILASANIQGDGGKVIIWGNDACGMYGSIEACGGPLLGNGGFVEISSKGILAPVGIVSTLASNGINGVLLLDPINITISNGADSNLSWNAGTTAYEADPITSQTGTLNITTMLTQLQSTSVIVDATSGTANRAGDISVEDSIAITSAHDGNVLYLKAYNDITISAAITVTGSSANVAMGSGFDGDGEIIVDSSGSITFDATSTGNLIMAAQGGSGGDITLDNTTPTKSISFKSSGTCYLSTKGEAIDLGGSIGSVTFASGDQIIVSGDIEVENGTLKLYSYDTVIINDPVDLTGPGLHEFTSSTANISISDEVTITGTGSGSLTLLGYQNVNVDQPITVDGSASLVLETTISNVNIAESITMNTTGELTITTGDTLLVQDLVLNSNASSGDMNITVGGDFLINPTLTDTPAGIGAVAGTLTASVFGNLTLTGGDVTSAYVQIGYPTASSSQDIVITSVGGDVLLQGGLLGESACYAVIGHGLGLSLGAPAVFSGDITISSITGDLNVYGGSSDLCFAQIGHIRGTGESVTATGDISIPSIGDGLSVVGGTGLVCYALIGHGGRSAETADTYSGSVTVALKSTSPQDIIITSGTQRQSFAGVGHIGLKSGTSGGDLTINNVPQIQVTSANGIMIRARSSAESFIGARFMGTAGATGSIDVTSIEVITQNNGPLRMESISDTEDFHGNVIGAYANINQVFPLTSAGNAKADLTLTIDGNLTLDAGLQTNAAQVYNLITNYSGTPDGASTITANIAKNVTFRGGGGFVGMTSGGPFSFMINNGGILLSNPVGTDANRRALIAANGTLDISANILALNGILSGPTTDIENALGNTTITTKSDMILLGGATINNLSGSGSLSLNVAAGSGQIGDLSITGGAYVKDQGSGAADINVGSNLFIEARAGGNSYISSAQGISVDVGEQIHLAGSSMGSAEIIGGAVTTVNADKIFLVDESDILTSSGALSVTTQDQISLNVNSSIQITGGIGDLTVIAGTGGSGDLSIINNSEISNSGTGNISLSTPNNFNLLGGNAGNASLTALGGITVNASSDISMKGASGGATIISAGDDLVLSSENVFMAGLQAYPSTITTSSGDLTIAVEDFFSADSHGRISITGGTGNVSVVIGLSGSSDSYLSHNSSISNLGSGSISFTTPNNFIMMSGRDGSTYLQTASGDIVVTAEDVISIESIAGSDAYISSGGDVTLTSDKISIDGEGNDAYVTSTGGDVLLLASSSVDIIDQGSVSNSGSGSVTIVVDQATPLVAGTGRFTMTYGSTVTAASGDLRVFSAVPDQNEIGGTLNGYSVTDNTTYQVYDVAYQTYTGDAGDPYVIFYKVPGVGDQTIRLVGDKSSELNQIIDREMNKIPKDESFELFVNTANSRLEKVYTPAYSKYPFEKNVIFLKRYIGFFANYDKKYINDHE